MRRTRKAALVAGAFAALHVMPCRTSAALIDTIGYTALDARPGALRADGAGITVAQVEAPPTGTANYSPDPTLAVFAGKTFTDRSGATGVSGHANEVADLYYGATLSAAAGVTNVVLFSASSFLSGLLHTGQTGRAPGAVKAQVVNNSWIAGFTSNATNIDVLRRLDDAINTQDLLVFNAVDNNVVNGIPKLLASAYNGISVGTLTGAHGPFTFDAPGPRIKPDLVVNTGVTSDASAIAAGAGALLRSEAAARKLPAGELAIKAIMMAGAERDAEWHRGRRAGADNRTAPLDFQQGAGQLRVDQSFDVLTAGVHRPGVVTSAAAGWDQRRSPAKVSQDATYYLRVDQAEPQWAAVLTWNRQIAGLSGKHYSTQSTMADFAMSLYLQRKGGRRLVASSDSPNDNVETLTLTDLVPGTYQMVLSTDRRAEYAVAWYADGDAAGSSSVTPENLIAATNSDMATAPTAMPAPDALLLLMPVMGTMLLRRPKRRNGQGAGQL